MAMNCKARCGKFVVLAILGVAALGGVVMALWNWLVPALFVGGREIGYLQALGLLLLSRILFGGLRGHGRWHSRRWEQMTPEERQRFESGMRGWCGKPKPDEPAIAEGGKPE